MAFNGGRTSKFIEENLKQKEKHEGNKLDNIESKLQGTESRISTGFSLEPSVKEKIKRLAKKHHYRSMSNFVNDVFKYWD